MKKKHPLQEWIDDNSYSHDTFGKLVGRGRFQIWRYVNGASMPPPEVMQHITKVTRLVAEDFYPHLK